MEEQSMNENLGKVKKIGKSATDAFNSKEEMLGLLENAPINIMYADLDFNIRYLNRKSHETLKTLEKHMPITADQMVGANIDVFHKNPAHQRKILGNDRNLPHKAIIQLGPEKLELLATAVYDERRQYSGIMVAWDIVTKKLETETNLARVYSMMENAPVNIMSADLDFNLVYMNKKSALTLKVLEKAGLLPFPIAELTGKSIDIFHKNPGVIRKILSNDANFPHRAKIKLGDQILDLLVTGMYDNNKKYMGPMVTWELITAKEKLVRTLEETSQQLGAAAEELSATATQLSENAKVTSQHSNLASANTEEVSKGVHTVATNTEEMVASIKEIARNSAEAANISKETLRRAQETNKTITTLGQSSIEIGNVIKVISSIAQQTNLLALNATIEAARAGEAGKGFAVVANEVKELAKQTAKATEDITNRISGIQKDTQGAVESIGGISTVIEKLNGISMSIAASIEEQTATTNEVARVVKESNKAVEGIAEVVKKVSTASNQNATGAGQTLDAARGLSTLAEKLRELIKGIQDQ